MGGGRPARAGRVDRQVRQETPDFGIKPDALGATPIGRGK
jgi:hypothetical protein